MGLKQNRSTKSVRIPCVKDDGMEVFVCNAQYSNRGIFINFEMLDQEYCSDNKEDIQDTIAAFIPQINELLAMDDLPIISIADKA